jgi:hypothetical protein
MNIYECCYYQFRVLWAVTLQFLHAYNFHLLMSLRNTHITNAAVYSKVLLLFFILWLFPTLRWSEKKKVLSQHVCLR